ncbi:MAG TPA: PatB family C-S lyase [Candidatus Enterocloster excrementipullorum]|uniref:cysteine-S-conjugate beta-lyase n=1 Tax=Candidatus Enterocloster excrementipullorum TaxID=2838559 RepID=A0A9D2SIV0_9FIRM|nr:PatB family C-S lyase [Candidatus Enterocloster excrementipullorum]
MGVNFDQAIDRRNTNCSKYDGMEASFGRNDLLPLWIADMDFPVPEAVTEALKKRAEHPVYGYNIFPEGYFEAFASWTERHHDWSPKSAWVCHTPGVLTALSTAILAFTEPGDPVLIQPPVYFPFQSTLEALGRTVLNNQLLYEDGHFSIDFADFEEKAKTAKMFIFCSPHNPSGRVWKKEELERIEAICRENDLLVFSDEIHCDIVYQPNTHTVFANLSEWASEHSIIAMAPSKTFNLAGLEMSHITIPNKALREKFQYLLRFGLHVANGNSFGIAAAQAAYAHGEEWYQELMAYLTGNIEFLDEALKKWIPQVTLVRPESTYIPLLDMEGLHMDSQELWDFMIQEAGAALHTGRTFGAGGERFMRINIGTQRANLELFVERLRAALQRSAPARIG